MRGKFCGLVAILVLVFGGSASAGTVIIGTADSANGDFVGNSVYIANTFGATEYQQVYGSTDFSGSLSINGIIFYDTLYTATTTTPESGTFTFSLSYTTVPVNGLSTNFASNIGTGSTTVFTGSLPAIVSEELVIPLSTSFVYNPSLGNLLLTVTASGLSGGSGALDSDNGDSDNGGRNGSGLFSRAYQVADGTGADDGGLVTGFEGGQLATPLPATFPLFATGLGAMGLLGWRRKRKDAAALAAA
jgi:hypothetical protein